MVFASSVLKVLPLLNTFIGKSFMTHRISAKTLNFSPAWFMLLRYFKSHFMQNDSSVVILIEEIV